MSRDLARYARSGAWSTVAYAIQVTGALAVSIVVVRALGEKQWGVLSEIRQLVQLCTILGGMALERSILRFLPQLISEKNEAGARSLFRKTMGVRLLLWLPLFVLALVFGRHLDRFFHLPVFELVLIGVASSLVFSLFNHVRAAASARFRTRSVALGTAVGSLVTLAATLWVLANGKGVAGVLVAAALGMGVAAVVQLPAAMGGGAQAEASSKSNDSFSLREHRFLAYAFPFAGIAILNYVVHSATEVFFLGHFHGPILAGFYVLGFSFAQRLIDFLPLALWEVSMAGFAEVAVRDARRLPAALLGYVKLLYIVLLPLACLGVAFSPALIRVLYGEAMVPSALVSQAYFAIAAVAAVGAPIGMVVYARDRTASALKAYTVFAVANIGLDWVLIPSLGLWGAILGLGTAKILSVLLMSRIAWQESPALRIPWTFLLKALLACSPVFLWWLVPSSLHSPLPLVGGLVGSVLLLIVSFRLVGVIGISEASLIRGTQLPLRNSLLQLLGAPTSGAEPTGAV